MNDMKTKAYEKAYAIAVTAVDSSGNSAVLPAVIWKILQKIETARKLTVQKKDALLQRIKNESEDNKKRNSPPVTAKQRNTRLHELTVATIKDTKSFPIMESLKTLDEACEKHGFENTVGTTLPDAAPDGDYYVFVALNFLSAVKKMIMKLALAEATKRIKKGETGDFTQKIYDFVNYSLQGNDLRNRLAKKGYPRPVPKGLADTDVMIKWTKRIRELERAAFRKLKPGKKLPKRLQDPRGKGRGKKGKGKRGKRNNGSNNSDLVVELMKTVLQHRNRNKPGKRHRQPKRHTFDGPSGDPGVWKYDRGQDAYDNDEEEQVLSPSGSSTWRQRGNGPGQWDRVMVLPPVPVHARMQRGYF